MDEKNEKKWDGENLPFVFEDGAPAACGLRQEGADAFALDVPAAGAALLADAFYAMGAHQTGEGLYCLCLTEKTAAIACNGKLWLLPQNGSDGAASAVCISGAGEKTAEKHGEKVRVCLAPGSYTATLHPARPVCDVMGKRLVLGFEGGEELETAYAHFYWGTMLPSVIEKTDATGYPVQEGYVVSTLRPDKYAGTYPDVDHEFQCKGRMALLGSCELAVVQRMMELQFKMMREDPAGLWRNPCAVQPDGTREYHVRRNSLDGTENAEMFLVTGNIEVLETAWLYFAATKNEAWLRAHIEDLEGAASLLEHLTDRNGRLWSDVFYEDQVIKDGAECMSAAMAAHGLQLLAALEKQLGRGEQESRFATLAARIAQAMVKPVPAGFWDEENHRFVDWVDRSGRVHDHIHLLGNCLPVLFGYATPTQARAVESLIGEYFDEFQRFPTFLSPCIADYRPDEMGTAGPYDLCAAGRYWCWDAAYWAQQGRGQVLRQQLHMVAAQAQTEGYYMGERYDMNHVYYQDDKNWHGAAYYYEYPCVFTWVLAHEYLGLRAGFDVDVELCPRLATHGKVVAEAYGVQYDYQPGVFTLTNIADGQAGQSGQKTFRLLLEGLYPGKKLLVNGSSLAPQQIHSLSAGQSLVVQVQ